MSIKQDVLNMPGGAADAREKRTCRVNYAITETAYNKLLRMAKAEGSVGPNSHARKLIEQKIESTQLDDVG